MARASVQTKAPHTRHAFGFRRPTTTEGRLSLRLVVGGLLLVPLAAAIVAATDVHGVGAAALAGLLSIVVGGVFAIVAVTRRGERSSFVLATLLVWAVAAFLLIGELAFPH
jgi:hypothetical protein